MASSLTFFQGEEMLKSILLLKEQGYKYKHLKNDHCEKHIIYLEENLELSLLLWNSQGGHLMITGDILEGIQVNYTSRETNLFESEPLVDVAIVKDRLEFGVFRTQEEWIKTSSYFSDLQNVSEHYEDDKCVWYSVKCDFLDKLRLNLTKYTNDEILLRFFSRNKLVVTTTRN